MNYLVSTFLDEESWEKFGLNWLRSAKSASLQALIIGKNLPEVAQQKIQELNYKFVPVENKFKTDCNFHYTLSRNLEKGQRCLWTRPDLLPKAGFETDADVTCSYSNININDLVSPVINLYDRAAMIQSLQQNIEKIHGKYLSSNYMLGTSDFWNGLFGCRAYLFERGYLQGSGHSDDLVLNFFIVFANSFSVEVKNYA